MKQIYLIFTLLCFANMALAQPDDTRAKTVVYIRWWGFMKYYHPALASGKVDWDKEFMDGILKLPRLESKTELNEYLIQRINSLGRIPVCKSCRDTIPGGMNGNLNINWINDSSVFTPAMIGMLNFIRENRNQKQNHYAYLKRVAFVVPWSGPTFEKEKPYADSVFPSVPMRLLTLARYWNIVNYYFPYKYALDQDWNSVLTESTKKFYEANDTLSYHLAILDLTTKINDSHSSFLTPQLMTFFGTRQPAFSIRIIDDKPIINDTFFPDSLRPEADIQRGDVILTVDGVPARALLDEKMKYMQGSNKPAKLRNLAYYLLRGQTDSVTVAFDRTGRVFTKTIPRYTLEELTARLPSAKNPAIPKAWRIVDGNMGYIYLGRLKAKEVDEAMTALMGTRGLILDCRNYPGLVLRKLGGYFNVEKKPFAKLTTPDRSFPGVMKLARFAYTGRNQAPVYKGRVVVLMNEQTQSMAEFTVMALQTGRDVVTVGSQTSGADGDARKIPLPGGFVAIMTGLGVYYPDGRETQRIGIVPDVEVKPTVEGIRAGRDEVFEEAKKVINGERAVSKERAF